MEKIPMHKINPTVEVVKVRVLPDGRMPPRSAAAYIYSSEKTLATWRCEGRGPRWVRTPGTRKIFYYQKDLDRFIRDGHGREAA